MYKLRITFIYFVIVSNIPGGERGGGAFSSISVIYTHMKRKQEDGPSFSKNVADKVSKDALLLTFMGKKSTELEEIPPEVIVNDIILRSLPRFIQLMLINKALRNSIEGIPDLYYNLFRYHFPEYYMRLYDRLSMGKFYDLLLYETYHEKNWLASLGNKMMSLFNIEEKEVRNALQVLFSIDSFLERTDPLKMITLDIPSVLIVANEHIDRYANKKDNQFVSLVNRLLRISAPLGVNDPSYYTESYAYFREKICIPLLGRMFRATKEGEPKRDPFYVLVTKMREVRKANMPLLKKWYAKRFEGMPIYEYKMSMSELIGECTEIDASFLYTYLGTMLQGEICDMSDDLRKYISEEIFPLLLGDDLKRKTEKNDLYIDTITREMFGRLLLDSFAPAGYYRANIDHTDWSMKKSIAKDALEELRQITFDATSLDAIEKAEIALMKATRGGFEEWLDIEETPDLKIARFFRLFFYNALHKDGINVARHETGKPSIFDSYYCHACPMKAIYIEGGDITTSRLFCSAECHEMTL